MRAPGYASPLYRLLLAGRAPDRIVHRPTDIVPGEVKHGTSLLQGDFDLAGHKVRTEGEMPWRMRPKGDPWHAELHSFSWLRDLGTVGSSQARARARQIVASWIKHFGEWDAPSWRPDILGRRIAAWLCQNELLLKEAEPDFARRYFQSLARQARFLARTARRGGDGAARLAALKGLIYSGVCLSQGERRAKLGLKLLEQELPRQILGDGGHCERAPSIQLSVLRDLVDLRETLLGAHRELPAALLGAIDRMAPMLRTFRHGDGGLALFNGGVEEDGWLVDLVLAQADAKGRPLASAPHSGFESVRAGQALLLVDTGKPSTVGERAHAGVLSFELSLGKDRLVVNCGAYRGPDGAWRRAMRSTAAHSTLGVDDLSSSAVSDDGALGRGPSMVATERKESGGNTWLEMSHDGFLGSCGLNHRRRLYLAGGGDDLRGEDVLVRQGRKRGKGNRFAVRFHLHPDVKASLVRDGDAVLLRLPSGAGWQVRAAGGRLGLTESVYLGVPGERRRTEQIVIEGPVENPETVVKWAFRRIAQE